MSHISVTRKELSNLYIEDFQENDTILVNNKYLIKVKYKENTRPLSTTVSVGFKTLSSTAGVRGGRPYYIDDFISKRRVD